jgi:DNA-binding GntR family transcriptional regulator
MELVYHALKNSILEGKWKPGERKNANEIGRILHVSRTPVIGASRLLEMEGLLKILPQVGLEASKLTSEEVEEMFHIRGVLEGLAAAQACRRLTDKKLEKIEQLIRTGDQYVTEGNYKRFSEVNRELHEFIRISSGMPHLIALLGRYWNNGNRYSKFFNYMPELSVSAAKDHHEILDALKKRDPQQARAAVESHANRFLDALSKYLRGRNNLEDTSSRLKWRDNRRRN